MVHIVDEAEIFVRAGKGGDGLTSFLHEKFKVNGGPNGGDGGRGGDVVFVADENEHTLMRFLRDKNFFAEDGENGKRKKMRGKNGEDLIAKVPVGTQILDEKGKIIFDFTHHGESYVVAIGGRGGFGNAHFASSNRQRPDFSELGDPGQELKCKLVLKLIADVGIIGLPNAGKSTLISRISDSRPKIANYPFTTLEPHLGVVEFHGERLVFADVPGLIEGASLGKGLGHKFLKHIERCVVLIHLLDGTSENLQKDFEIVENELKKFSPYLAKKKRIVVLNKSDAIDLQFKDVIVSSDFFSHNDIIKISAVSGNGIKELLTKIFEVAKKEKLKLSKSKLKKVEKEKENVIELSARKKFFGVKKISSHKFEIFGEPFETLGIRTNWINPASVRRFVLAMRRRKLDKELQKLGISDGDLIIIGKNNFFWNSEF
ncbi:MAG: GTPase ObgE [Patescibacteria group bacterium]